MLNPWLLLGLIVAWGATIAAAGYTAYGAGQDRCIAEQVRDVEVANIATEAATKAAAAAISKIEVKHTTIRQELEREIRTNTVFRDCRSGDAARGLFNAAIPADPQQPAPDGGELPASNPSR